MKNDDFWDFAAFWEFFNPFKDKKSEEKQSASKTIKKTHDINSLILDLMNEDKKVADSAQETLERLGEPVIPLLVQALGNENLSIRGGAGWALVKIGKVVVNPVIEALHNENPEVRFYAAFVLQMLRDERAIEPLIKVLKEDKDDKVRSGASFALFAIKDPRAEEPLKQYGKEIGITYRFEDEPYIPPIEPHFYKDYKEKFENLKKDFDEKIMPILKDNPGIFQRNLYKDGFDASTFYWMARVGLIKREKSGNSFTLFLSDSIPSNEESVKLMLPPSEKTLPIPAKAYPDSKERIIKYFGRDVLKKLFERSKEYQMSQNQNMRFGDLQDRFISSGWQIVDNQGEKDKVVYLYSEKQDDYHVNRFLANIGACLDLKMNEPLLEIISKYWTKECDEKLRNHYSKYGFFSGSFNLEEILGKERKAEFYLELEEKAKMFEITWCGFLWDNIHSYHIPFNYEHYLKFKWGLKPEMCEKKCIYCNCSFYPLDPDFPSVSVNFKYYPIVESIKEVNFCPKHYPPFSYGVFLIDESDKSLIKKRMANLLKKLTDTLGFIPPTDFHESLRYLTYSLPREKFEEAVKIINDMPPFEKLSAVQPQGYKDVFGSWLQALDAAGILEGGVRKTSRGYICFAKDGHECRSIGEKIIDDYLFSHNISHEQEPHYPGERQFRADWKVGQYFIEFWGLKGDEDYDKKIEDKKAVAQQYQISLIEITFDDLRNLEQKLKVILVK